MLSSSVDFSGRPFHFIGIGGIGMSALAHVLACRGIPVSGSDLSLSHITRRLESKGAYIFNKQQAENISFFTTLHGGEATQLPQVVCSTAIREDNLEFREAKALRLSCFSSL